MYHVEKRDSRSLFPLAIYNGDQLIAEVFQVNAEENAHLIAAALNLFISLEEQADAHKRMGAPQ